MRGARGWATVFAVIALAMLPSAAHATFPGQPGKLVFEAPNEALLSTQYPNGGGLAQLTPGYDPAWSADGTRIAFIRPVSQEGVEVFVINQDGTGETRVTPSGLTPSSYDFWVQPAWSPDGTKIAFSNQQAENCTLSVACIFTINVDGTGFQELRAGSAPAWSPDGSRIAFAQGGQIWTMDPDGTDVTKVTTHDLPEDAEFSAPNWSPDGTKIAFTNCEPSCNPECCPPTTEVHLVNIDGTGHRRVLEGPGWPIWSPDGFSLLVQPTFGGRFLIIDATTGVGDLTEIVGTAPDWQPITGTTGHVRPKGSSPLRLSLVPAYSYCLEPNRTHGPPLAFESCNPPNQVSDRLTVGTPDANGRPAKSVSYLRFGVLRGNPSTPADEADVRIQPLITDIREQGSLADYESELGVRASLQITDRDNASSSAGPDAATVQIGSLAFEIPCVATADTTVGATCEAETTLEAYVPGVVKENQRAVWAVEAISVLDGGADGDANTADGDAVFLSPGVFVP
jgi:hypothetical protein